MNTRIRATFWVALSTQGIGCLGEPWKGDGYGKEARQALDMVPCPKLSYWFGDMDNVLCSRLPYVVGEERET
jgi:hypothetical protein